jgi:hypothetical protein
LSAAETKVEISDTGIKFSATADKKHYAFDFDFSANVDSKGSSFAIKDRDVEILLKKAKKDEWWTFLPYNHFCLGTSNSVKLIGTSGEMRMMKAKKSGLVRFLFALSFAPC